MHTHPYKPLLQGHAVLCLLLSAVCYAEPGAGAQTDPAAQAGESVRTHPAIGHQQQLIGNRTQ